MAKAKYDLYIERNPPEDDSSLIVVKFPAMRSQFENKPENIQLSMKPKSMKLKLEVSLDAKSSEFSREQAQVLATKSNPKIFPNNVVAKNLYASTKTTVDDGQLFVAKVVNNKLICRPISHFMAMRSDLSHFDLREEVDQKEEVRPISVKFAAPDRQNVAPRSFDSQMEIDDPMDEFKVINYRPLESKESTDERISLFGQQIDVVKVKQDPDGGEPLDLKPGIAMADIKPKVENMATDDIYSNSSSQQQNNQSPRKTNQIKLWVKDCLFKAKIVSFEEVYHFIRDQRNNSPSNGQYFQLNSKDILDALNDLALLVQGNWAVKSELLYGDSSERDCTAVTGISISLFIAARDYLLWLFTQNRIVSRPEFGRSVRIPDHDILELFNQLAIFRGDIRRWELKLPTDNRFLEQFPDVAQRQATMWKVRRANKLSVFAH